MLEKYVSELINTWIFWVKFNNLTKDSKVLLQDRVKAAKECELLIAKRYELIRNIDIYFEELNGKN